MHATRECPSCRTPLNNDAPDGFCPACMLEGALRLGSEPDPPSVVPGALPRIGDYQLLDEIARGGMGVVYRACQLSLNRVVAVKLILTGQFADQSAVRRFQAEASAAAKLRHPNIVAVHEIGDQSGQRFFSMEYVDGPNLGDFLRQQPISIRQVAQLVKKIGDAVQYAHEHGIVHRDLKPSNILIDGFFEPRITDFGLARDLKSNADLTITGQVLGSPNYISPEQASGVGASGPATDIYSLGAILYHLLAGRPPFAAETLSATLQQVTTADPISPRILNPSVPRDLDTICLKCLEKEPSMRYPAAVELAKDLERFLDGVPIAARAVGRAERAWRWAKRKPALASALALLLVVAIGSSIAAFRIYREREQARANESKAKMEAAKSEHVANFMKQMLKAVDPAIALGRDTSILREILDNTANWLDEELKQEPAVEAELRLTLGQVYWAIGEYNNAEQMLNRSLAIVRAVHGPKSVEAARTLETLAGVFRYNREHGQAMPLLFEALSIRTNLLGPDHPTVAALLPQLALASDQAPMDELVQLEVLHRNALGARRKLLGEEHEDIANLLLGLGIVFQNQGKLTEAELLYRQALAMQRKLWGQNHPNTVNSLAYVCAIVAHQNRLSEAETLYRELLTLVRRAHADDHIDVMNTLEYLGTVLRRQGKFSEAETFYRQALTLERKYLGEHPALADLLNRLGGLCNETGNYREAESFFREEVIVRKRLVEKDRPDIHWGSVASLPSDPDSGDGRNAASKTNITAGRRAFVGSLQRLERMLRAQGKWAEAKQIVLQAAQTGDFNALDSAAWYLATCPDPTVRDGDMAVSLAKRALAATGSRLPEILDTLAVAYAQSSRFSEAAGVQKEAINMVDSEIKKKEYRARLRLFESQSPYVEHWRMGAWLRDQGKFAEAESAYREELAMRRKMYSDDDIEVATTMNDISGVLRDQGKLAEAEVLARECLAIREKEVPEEWQTFETRSLLGSILLAQKRYTDAEPLLVTGYEGLKQRQEKVHRRHKNCLTDSLRNLVELYEVTGPREKLEELKHELVEFEIRKR